MYLKFRSAQLYVNDKWHDAYFEDIRKDDIFRLFESDGSPVYDNEGYDTFISDTDSTPLGTEGNAQVRTTRRLVKGS